MKLIFDSQSLSENIKQIEVFKKIYLNGFPDQNECEKFEFIENRVKGIKKETEPHSIILLDELNLEVTGGMIVDWYEKSKSIHLIYLIIDEKYRNKGIAKRLIKEGINSIESKINDENGIQIKNVFFESNNPDKTINDNFNLIERLEIFSRLGAKWIDIPYVQPALDTTKNEVDNLFLLTFPQFNVSGNNIPKAEIEDFLKDLYLGLDVKDLATNKSFQKMKHKLDKSQDNQGNIRLKSMPCIETPFYEFDKASVTLHFVENGNDKSKPANINNEFCDHFCSFEKDLQNFQNQKNIPFCSVFKEKILEAVLTFPDKYYYTSEGICYSITTQKNRINLNVVLSISNTLIINSGIRIWHLTIAPSQDQYFNEYDLIKLSSLFGSTQENSTVKENFFITVTKKGIKKLTPETLIRELYLGDDKGKNLKIIGTGIIQIKTSGLKYIHKNKRVQFYECFQSGERNKLEEPIKYFSKVLCGIILGIFDFDRMDDEEIYDTIQPIVLYENSFIVLCRGVLLKIAESDEIIDAVSDHIIVSPYMLIPNFVLAHNEYILSEAKIEIDLALDPNMDHKLKKLETTNSQVSNSIYHLFLTDIFQYLSEKQIIETGSVQRGISNLKNYIENRLRELSELIDKKRANKANWAASFLSALMLFITLIQINSVLPENRFFSLIGGYIYIPEVLFSIVVFFMVYERREIHSNKFFK